MKKVAVFMSAKGGSGTTFLSTNSALALTAATGASVVYVDLDLQYGDANIMLSIKPEKTLGDLIPVMDEVEIDDIKLVIAMHPTGLGLLACPGESEQSELFTPYHIKRLLMVLAQNFDVVIVNTKVGFDERVYAALEGASHVFLVTTAELTSLFATRRLINMLSKLSFPLDIVRGVINQQSAAVGLSSEEAAKILSPCPLVAEVAYDYPTVPSSISQGSPVFLDGASSTVNGINALAASISPYDFASVGRRLFAKLGG